MPPSAKPGGTPAGGYTLLSQISGQHGVRPLLRIALLAEQVWRQAHGHVSQVGMRLALASSKTLDLRLQVEAAITSAAAGPRWG